MESLNFSYYKDTILSIKRAKYHGAFINAKPILLISIMDAYTCQILIYNEIRIIDSLIELYLKNYSFYQPKNHPTPFYIPFFHLTSDGFWHLKLNEGHHFIAPKKTPSLKWQKEAIQFAFFTDSLFRLIQNVHDREKLKKEIIQYYFNDNKKSK